LPNKPNKSLNNSSSQKYFPPEFEKLWYSLETQRKQQKRPIASHWKFPPWDYKKNEHDGIKKSSKFRDFAKLRAV
jgi:hypothetical protein